MQKVADSFPNYRISTYLWDDITSNRADEYVYGNMDDGYIVGSSVDEKTGIIVSYPKFQTRYGTFISFKKGIWDPVNKTYNSSKLKVINVPVLKTHGGYGVTASVKNYMGVTSDKLSRASGGRAHNSIRNGGMGTQMAETRLPTLNILDAIWINANPRNGPSTSYNAATKTNIIAASTDPIALDYWAAKNILMPTANAKGYSDLSSLDPDNKEPGSFGDWLRLSKEDIIKSGYKANADNDRINVYVRQIGN